MEKCLNYIEHAERFIACFSNKLLRVGAYFRWALKRDGRLLKNLGFTMGAYREGRLKEAGRLSNHYGIYIYIIYTYMCVCLCMHMYLRTKIHNGGNYVMRMFKMLLSSI